MSNTLDKNLWYIPGGWRKTYLTFEKEVDVINWIKQNRLIKIVLIIYFIILYIIKIEID